MAHIWNLYDYHNINHEVEMLWSQHFIGSIWWFCHESLLDDILKTSPSNTTLEGVEFQQQPTYPTTSPLILVYAHSKGPKQRRHYIFDVWIKRLVYNGRTSLNVGNCTLVNTSNFISIWHAYFIDFNTCHALFSYTYWDSNITCRVAIGITMLVPPPI